MQEKPLFIPLKAQHFDAFERGEKTTEYRLYGPRWNETTCRPGRHVVLSRGYGKQRRLLGKITAFAHGDMPTKTAAWRDCYGAHPGPAACIQIELL